MFENRLIGGLGIIPLSTQIREYMKQQHFTDDRRGNIIIHYLPDIKKLATDQA